MLLFLASRGSSAYQLRTLGPMEVPHHHTPQCGINTASSKRRGNKEINWGVILLPYADDFIVYMRPGFSGHGGILSPLASESFAQNGCNNTSTPLFFSISSESRNKIGENWIKGTTAGFSGTNDLFVHHTAGKINGNVTPNELNQDTVVDTQSNCVSMCLFSKVLSTFQIGTAQRNLLLFLTSLDFLNADSF